MSVMQILRELVAFNTTSARTNAPMVTHLAGRAKALGLRVRQLPYTDDAGVEKINLIATGGPDLTAPPVVELALVGHTDTVPFPADWHEALILTERDGKLYGRGSCDTKGFIAAALTAVEKVGVGNLKKPFALIFTADEEIGCLGAKKLAELNPFQLRNAIVGEPTSLQPMRAGKGYCIAEVTVRGREGHSAYPAVGTSAIFHAARLVNRIEKIAEELKAETHNAFEPPYTTLNVGVINGGTAKNIIAGECKFTLEWRPVPGQPTARVVEMAKAAVDQLRREDSEFSAEVVATRLDSASETSADAPLVQLLEKSAVKLAGTVAFGTEAPQMIQLGADAVVFGPGDIRVAHRTGEYVPIDELERCVKVLQQAVEHFCL